MIKAVASLLILFSAVSADHCVHVYVSKFKFLFVKWANLSRVQMATVNPPGLGAVSKSGVFADSFGKVQSDALGVTVQYRFNDDKDYTAVPATKTAHSTNYFQGFTPTTDFLARCVQPDAARLTIDRAELAEAGFNVCITIKCEIAHSGKTVQGPVEVVKEGQIKIVL